MATSRKGRALAPSFPFREGRLLALLVVGEAQVELGHTRLDRLEGHWPAADDVQQLLAGDLHQLTALVDADAVQHVHDANLEAHVLDGNGLCHVLVLLLGQFDVVVAVEGGQQVVDELARLEKRLATRLSVAVLEAALVVRGLFVLGRGHISPLLSADS